MKILASYYFFVYLAFSAFLPYTSLYFSEKGFSSTTVGLILSLWAFVSVISQPVMGFINDRMNNPRQILILSSIAAPVSALGFYFFNQFAAIIAISIVFSWFQSASGPLSDAVAVDIGKNEGFSFGSIRLWGALSYSLGAFLTGFIYQKYGYENIFFFYLGISVFIVFTLLLFPKTQPSVHKTTIMEQAKEVVQNRPFLLFVGVSLLIVMSSAISFTFLPIYFKEMGFDKSWLGSAFALAAMIEVPMFWLSAKLSNKIGRFNVLSMSAALYSVRCLSLFAFHHVYLTLAMQLLDGISFAFVAGTSVEVVENLSGKRTRATAQTLYVALTWGVGGIVGNVAGGLIVDHMGVPFLYFILFVLCAAAAVLFAAIKNGLEQRTGRIKVPMN